MNLRIALVLQDLDDGGIQVSNLKLATALHEMGHDVELVLCRKSGVHLSSIPSGIKITGLRRRVVWRAQLMALAADPAGFVAMLRPLLLARRPPTTLRYLPSLAACLRHGRPDLVIASATHLNITTILARARIRGDFKLLVAERNTYSNVVSRDDSARKWRWRYLGPLVRRLYGQADGVVSVSKGVADDLSRAVGLARDRITTIYNPVVDGGFRDRVSEHVDHPWFRAGEPPVLLGMGRFRDDHKNFSVLIEALARVRKQIPARLMILGEGCDRARYERQVMSLGLSDCVELPGFIANPLPYLKHASCFVLSSTHEGLPAVLIEALACGCPVVSTDCPSGPREILDDGRYGALVPVGDPAAMADAIVRTLNAPPDSGALVERGASFSDASAVKNYLKLAGMRGAVGYASTASH